VAADEIELQLPRLVGGDADVGQLPEPRVDAVDRLAGAHGGLDRPARCGHRLQGAGIEGDGRVAARDGHDIGDRERMAV
jgi:hypothetical protein